MVLCISSLSIILPAFAETVQPDDDSTPSDPGIPTTGTRLSMYRALPASCSLSDPNVAAKAITWPANTAFNVRHGWVDTVQQGGSANGGFMSMATDFELYIDGVEQGSKLYMSSPFPTLLVKFNLINFPNGMTGTHLFQGWWFIDGSLAGGNHGDQVFALSCNLQITFQ